MPSHWLEFWSFSAIHLSCKQGAGFASKYVASVLFVYFIFCLGHKSYFRKSFKSLDLSNSINLMPGKSRIVNVKMLV